MPPLLLGTLLFFGLLLLSAALGRRLLRALRLPITAPAERGVLAAGLGLGALQALPFALFALGIGKPVVFRLAVVSLALVLLPDLRAVFRCAWRHRPIFRALRGWEGGILVILIALLSAIYLHALCPVTDDDGLSYHLTAAVRFLREGRFHYLPTLTYTNWPLGVEMWFALLLGLHPEAPVGLAQFACGLLTLAAVYLLGSRIGGRFVGTAAAALMTLYRVYWHQMAQAHVDLGMTLFATLAVFALLRAGEGREEGGKWVRLAGLFAGLAATTKLSGLWVPVALTLVLWQPPLSRAEGGRRESALACLLVALVVVAPWFVRTWAVTGNPFYPLFYPLLGGHEWTAEGWPRIQHYFFLLNMFPGLPPTRSALLAARLSLIALALLICTAVYLGTRRSVLAIPARFAAFFTLCVWGASGYNLRFLLAAYPSVMLSLASRLRGKERIAAPFACALAALMAWHIVGRANPGLAAAARFALGTLSREEYLSVHLEDYEVVEYANRHLPADARLLIGTWKEQTALYRASALRANYWLQDSIHYDTPERLEADLKRLGVTHLVLKPMEPEWCPRSEVCRGRERNETRALSDLARRRGVQLFAANGVSLYRLDLSRIRGQQQAPSRASE